MPQSKPDGGRAFPRAAHPGVSEKDWGGMTLRDYFAGQALTGLLADPKWTDVPHMSKLSYMFADAMIAARDA